MKEQTIEPLHIIGISVKACNVHERSLKSIFTLWNNFLSESVIEHIPNKVDSSIYCIYPNYENDYSEAYTVILGCKVENLNTIPKGMTGGVYNDAYHIQFVMKENALQKVVFNEKIKMPGVTLQQIFSRVKISNPTMFSTAFANT